MRRLRIETWKVALHHFPAIHAYVRMASLDLAVAALDEHSILFDLI
jgi:hypothetical protein